jgi:Arm DNA-binding domain
MLSKLLVDKMKPQAEIMRLADGRGMYLEIAPTGGKWWRFKYRIDGKEKRISLGVYPDVGLADARDKREQARKLLAAGIDPAEHRKAAQVALEESTENTFEAIAREWFGMFSTVGAGPRRQDHPPPRAQCIPVDRYAHHQSHHGAGVAGGSAAEGVPRRE